VLGNTATDGDALSAVLVSGPADGTLTFNRNGSFSTREHVPLVVELRDGDLVRESSQAGEAAISGAAVAIAVRRVVVGSRRRFAATSRSTRESELGEVRVARTHRN